MTTLPPKARALAALGRDDRLSIFRLLIPAAIAVWALVRPRVLLLYLGLSLAGFFLAGVLFRLV